jgi:hypothetical protein
MMFWAFNDHRLNQQTNGWVGCLGHQYQEVPGGARAMFGLGEWTYTAFVVYQVFLDRFALITVTIAFSHAGSDLTGDQWGFVW